MFEEATDDLVRLLAKVGDDQRFGASVKIPREHLRRHGEKYRQYRRETLGRTLGEAMLRTGDIEVQYARDRENQVRELEFCERWDIEVVVMSRAQYLRLCQICNFLIREIDRPPVMSGVEAGQ